MGPVPSPSLVCAPPSTRILLICAPDTIETYFDSHVDLLQRKLQHQLQKHGDRLKLKAEETFKIKDLSGDLLAENFEREVKNFKLKVCPQPSLATLRAQYLRYRRAWPSLLSRGNLPRSSVLARRSPSSLAL